MAYVPTLAAEMSSPSTVGTLAGVMEDVGSYFTRNECVIQLKGSISEVSGRSFNVRPLDLLFTLSLSLDMSTSLSIIEDLNASVCNILPFTVDLTGAYQPRHVRFPLF
jgi:hypothetical protein